MNHNSATFNKFGFSPGTIYRRADALYTEQRDNINNFIGLDLNNLGRKTGTNPGAFVFKGNKSDYVRDTSIFDSYLSYLMTYWYSPIHGKCIDPFAGGITRGAVCSLLNRKYVGIDLSSKQIDSNNSSINEILKNNIDWINDDSLCYHIDDLYDFMITCPPYYQMEKYSNDERDLSNHSIDSFNNLYKSIIAKYINALRDRSFAVIVVGDYCNKKKYIMDSITIDAAQEGGAYLYNILYINNDGATSALTGSGNFKKYGLIRSSCEKALIFYKGDLGDASKRFNELLNINAYNGTFLKPIDCINEYECDC